MTPKRYYKVRYHVGWLWRPPTHRGGKGRGWVFRVELEGRTYPDGSEFLPVYADEPLLDTKARPVV